MNSFLKKLLFFIFCLFFSTGTLVSAEGNSIIQIDFFYSDLCPHCANENEFLEGMEEKYSNIQINRYSILDSENAEILVEKYQEFEVPEEYWGSIPVTFINDKYYLGFSLENTGKTIESVIVSEIEGTVSDVEEENNSLITIPLIGEIDVFALSPLALSIILGTLDGFNACAMVALGFLLAVLISTGVRKRIILIGGVFILVSGLIYFIFISAWLNLFLLLSHLKIITVIIGIVIVIFALSMLKDYFSGVVCKLCRVDPNGKEDFATKTQRKLFTKMEKFINSDMPLPVVLLSIALVAAGINTVELFCSFGFPAAFTKILTSMDLATSSYYFYLFLYIVFYMIDDFIIFLIAVFTLKITQASERYLKIIKLISAVALLILGLVILLNPSFLMSI